jgi:hypothetical protein
LSRPLWAAAAGLVVAAAVAAAAPDALVGVFYDDGLYAVLARSISEGHGFRFLHLPDAPPATHYPPLYPVFLAGLSRLGPGFPADVPLLKAANAVLMGTFAAVTALHAGSRAIGKAWAGAGVTAAACLAVPLVAVATVLFAEPLFLVLAALALWCADASREGQGRAAVRMAVAAGALAALAALTRTIGVAVIAGVVLALRRRNALAAALPAVALLAPWLWWVAAQRGALDGALASNYGTYADLVAQSGFGWLSPRGVADAIAPLGRLALPGLPGPVWMLGVLLMSATFLVGAARVGRRTPAMAWTLAAYLPVVALWPYGPDRFLWAALPWIALTMGAGLLRVAELSRGAGPRRRLALRAWLAVTAVLLLSGFGANTLRGHLAGAATSEQRGISETMKVAVDWVRESTDSGAVIATEDEALIWLYTGRKAVPSFLWRARGRGGESLGADTLNRFLERQGATHVILTGHHAAAAPTLDELLGRYPGRLRLVRVWEWGMLAFEVRRS